VGPSATYCPTCGARAAAAPPTERWCPNGHRLGPTAAYCPACGARAADATAPALSPTVGFAAPPPAYPAASYPTSGAAYPAAAYPPSFHGASGSPAAYPPAPYPPQGYAQWGTYNFVPQRPVAGLAIAAFVVSLVWLYGVTSVVAIALGIAALHRSKERHERGRGLAIAGIVIGGVGACIGLGVLLAHVG
jgi:hypothetical protein